MAEKLVATRALQLSANGKKYDVKKGDKIPGAANAGQLESLQRSGWAVPESGRSTRSSGSSSSSSSSN